MTEQTAASPLSLARRSTLTIGRFFNGRIAKRALPIVILIATLSVAAFAIHHEVQAISLKDVIARLADLPTRAILWSLVFTLVSYVTLIGYDASAFHYLRIRTPTWRLIVGSFCGYAVANTAGFALLTGAAARYRIHASGGLSFYDAGRIALFSAFAFAAGVSLIGALGLLLAPDAITGLIGLPAIGVRIIAVVMLAAIGALLAASAWGKTLRVGRFSFTPPSFKLAMAQLALSIAEILASGAALYMLLPPGSNIGYPEFLPVYCAALAAGILSHVPGGVGVFDAVILASFSWRTEPGGVVAALLAYRFIYYLLPFVLSLVVLAIVEMSRHGARALGRYVDIAESLAPWMATTVSLGVAAILLLSGATGGFSFGPATPGYMPDGMVEAATFLSSVVATALMFLAYPLQQRLNAAFWLTITLLVTAAGLALLKDLAYVEATLYFLTALILLPFRDAFSRTTAFVDQPLTTRWLLGFGLMLLAAGYVTFFAFDDKSKLPNADPWELWWFVLAFEDDVSRRTRALVAAGVTAFLIAILYLTLKRPSRRAPAAPTPEEMDAARRIVVAQNRAEANLDLIGDKTLFFSGSGASFIAFRAVSPPSARGEQSEKIVNWVAFGDPVGSDASERRELIRTFRDEALLRPKTRPIFYLASHALRDAYADAGFNLVKIAEEARVRLAGFDPETMKGLKEVQKGRNIHELTFELFAPRDVAAALPFLEQVSKKWRSMHNRTEFGFFLGRFDPEAMTRSTLGLVRREGRPVAFATVLRTASKSEAMLDLFRFLPDALGVPKMYLMKRLMLALREEGIEEFSLGVSPIAEAEPQQIREHGERFYRTRDLRPFKEKFNPVWTPRYLAHRSGEPDWPLALKDAEALIKAT